MTVAAGSAEARVDEVLDVSVTRAAVRRLVEISADVEAIDRERTVLVAEVLRTGWWRLEGARTPAAWLTVHLGLGVDDARVLVRRAELCASLPRFVEAYTAGHVGGAHLDTLTGVVAGRWDALRADEAVLVEAAVSQGVRRWADTCADWAARRSSTDAEERYASRSLRVHHDLFGDLHGRFHLPGDDGHRVAEAIDAATAAPDHWSDPMERTFHARRADALVELVCGNGDDRTTTTTVVVVERDVLDRDVLDGDVLGRAGPAASAPPTRDLGTADHRDGGTLSTDVHRDSGTTTTVTPGPAGWHGPAEFDPQQRCDHQSWAIGPATAARLVCDALVVRAHVGGDGSTIDVGRASRTFSTTQRRALAVVHRRCGFPGCEVAFHRCQLHHVVAWHPDGRTDIDNAVPVCRWHHHLVHEQRWTITRQGDHWHWHPPPDDTS